MIEEWIELKRPYDCNRRTVVAFSNMGRIRRKNGSVEDTALRQKIVPDKRKVFVYRLVADHFLVTVRRPDQTHIDHITHNPTEYAVNDVRNLRWCTNKENGLFAEARENKRKKCWHHMPKWSAEKRARYSGANSCHWKGDNVGSHAKWARKKAAERLLNDL